MKSKLIYLIILLFLFTSCGIIRQGQQATQNSASIILEKEGFSLTWEDQFHSLNRDSWTIGLKDSISGDMVPGAHGQYLLNDNYDAYFTEDDVYIENGNLILRNQKRDIQGSSPDGTFSYSSGWIMSMHKVFFQEGYLEVKAKFPKGDKVWPAIWLIPEDLTWCPEWDLFEYFGYRKDKGYDQMGMHLCYSSYPNQQWADEFMPDLDQNYHCEKWHTYGFVWTKEYAAWYIDGKEVRRLSSEGIADWPAKDMYIVLNNGTRTESPDEQTSWPNYLKINYIKLYTK